MLQQNLVDESKNNCSQFDCRHWLGKSSQTLKMLSGKLRSCYWTQFLDKCGKFWEGLLIHPSSLSEGLNPSLEAGIERINFLILPVEMITTAYPAWREVVAVMNYLSVAHCKKNVLWLIIELRRKWFLCPKRFFKIKNVLQFHPRIKPKLFKKILEKESEQDPPTKNTHQSYV